MEENLPFPLVKKEISNDRSFKTIALPSSTHEKIKIKAIDINSNEIMSLEKRTVPLGIPASEFDSKNSRYRIRAKLSMADSGIKESHWVTQQRVNDAFASHFNQFRIRGIAQNGQHGDWVYSNIKDFKNEDVLFELIHDVLDLILYTEDSQLDFVVESMLQDTLQSIYQDKHPSLERKYDHTKSIAAEIQELSEVMSQIFQSTFKEKVMASPEEFTTFVRSYNVMDYFMEKQEDFLTLLVESFLDDQLENIVKKTNFEAILQNDEEIQALIQSLYEFDVKASMVSSLYSSDLYDHFETTVTDAVKLISEPAVYEEIVYKQNESYYNLFKMMLRELYTPLLVLDRKSVDLARDITDELIMKPFGGIIEYNIMEGDTVVQHMILTDILEMVLQTADAELEEVAVDLLDHILTPPMEKKLSLWIDYAPIEFIQYMAEIREKIHQDKLKVSKDHDFIMGSGLNEKHQSRKMKKNFDLKEAYRSSLMDLVTIQKLNHTAGVKEEVVASVIDAIIHQQKKRSYADEDQKAAHALDDFKVEDTKNQFASKALQKVLFSDTVYYSDNKEQEDTSASIQSGFLDGYYNLYKPHMKDSHFSKKEDDVKMGLNSSLSDNYILNEYEFVHYSVDGHTAGTSLGEFVLGTNTLRGRNSS